MKNITKKALEDALTRLIDGKPTNIDLKKKARKGKLKIHDNSVEKEAGLSGGALRHHPDVKAKIKAQSLNAKVEASDTSITAIEVLENEIKQLRKEKTSLGKSKDKYYKDSKSHEDALAKQAATHIKIVQELMEMIPETEREKAMDRIVNSRPDNIIKGSFQ